MIEVKSMGSIYADGVFILVNSDSYVKVLAHLKGKRAIGLFGTPAAQIRVADYRVGTPATESRVDVQGNARSCLQIDSETIARW